VWGTYEGKKKAARAKERGEKTKGDRSCLKGGLPLQRGDPPNQKGKAKTQKSKPSPKKIKAPPFPRGRYSWHVDEGGRRRTKWTEEGDHYYKKERSLMNAKKKGERIPESANQKGG